MKFQSPGHIAHSKNYIWKCRLHNVDHLVQASMCYFALTQFPKDEIKYTIPHS